MRPERARPDRILIIGGSGSGKTRLARALGESLSLPIHNLDDLARRRDANRQDRPAHERTAGVTTILESQRWIAEGVHLDWTDPLLEAADVIIWLDQVSWRQASRAIIRRFLSQSLSEARRQKGLRRFTRVRDYVFRLRELLAAIPEARAYHRANADGSAVTRAATARRLAPHLDKVVHCRTTADVQAIRALFKSRSS